MKYNIINQESFPLLEFTLDHGEEIYFEPDAMVYFENGITIKGKKSGGIISATAKKLLTDENFLIGYATNEGTTEAKIGIAPKGVGEVNLVDVTQTGWYITDGAYLANTKDVEINVVKQKSLIGSIFSSTGGLFILKASGNGTVIINAFGGIKEVQLNNDTISIDNGHIVAWEENLEYKIKKAGKLKSSFASGEGLIAEFSGTGKILVQTRKIESFVDLLIPFMPEQKSNID